MRAPKQLLVSIALAGSLAGGIYYGGQAVASDAGPELAVDAGVAAVEKPMANHVLEGQPAPSADEIQSDGEAIREASKLYELVTSKSWLPVVGTVLMLLVWVVRRFVFGSVAWFHSKLGGAVLAFGLSAVVVLAVGLQSAEFSIGLVGDALATGLAAAGAWHSRKLLQPGAATPPPSRRG